jgi:maleate cis-trans isomerase
MSRDKDVTYEEIEELTKNVKDFVKEKGFEIIEEFEFLTRIEKVLYEEIQKYYE